jgi:hypothetical protein
VVLNKFITGTTLPLPDIASFGFFRIGNRCCHIDGFIYLIWQLDCIEPHAGPFTKAAKILLIASLISTACSNGL